MRDILLTQPLFPTPATREALEARLTPHARLHRLYAAPDRDALLAEIGPSIGAIATAGSSGPIGEVLFARLPALQLVANFGTGYDNIDVTAAAARGITVTHTPGVLDDEVADLTIGLLLATLRQIPQADRYVRAGRWLEKPYAFSPTLRGRSVGILGLGAIGRAVAHRLEAFGVAIAYHGRSRQNVPYAYYDSPVGLAQAVDTLVVLAPGGAATRHMVNAQVLAALGPDGVLINVARGSVVDEAALIAALQAGTILSAGLDVFEHEPRVPAELLALPQVVCLPHIGSASQATRAAMGGLVVDNLLAWCNGAPLPTPVPEMR
jgi:lactate dehydrogenase-like 2-hydroxyacid dehydrogenase